MSKKFGLIVPGSKKAPPVQPKADFTKPSIFGSDSDSDDAPQMRKISTIGPGVNEKRQARKIQQKALAEDPTIFQYDELYEEIENKRDQEKIDKSKEQRKPKYINRLLECAERRRIESERRLERMIQKERDLEGEEFKDKETFVTSAYRKKLEELRKAEEREKREEYLEAIGDVTKQQNLDGFYRHLYEQKLGKDEKVKEDEKEVDDDDAEDEEKEYEPDKTTENQTSISTSKFKSTKARTYRKRKSSDEDEAGKSQEYEEVNSKKTHLASNIDADSDFSIDSSSSENEDETDDKKSSENKNEESIGGLEIKKEPVEEGEFKVPAPVDNKDKKAPLETKVEIEPKAVKNESDDIKPEDENEPKVEAPKINKKDIWKKRTVGEVFEAALQRYYERKAARNG